MSWRVCATVLAQFANEYSAPVAGFADDTYHFRRTRELPTGPCEDLAEFDFHLNWEVVRDCCPVVELLKVRDHYLESRVVGYHGSSWLGCLIFRLSPFLLLSKVIHSYIIDR